MAHLTRPAEISGVSAGLFPEPNDTTNHNDHIVSLSDFF